MKKIHLTIVLTVLATCLLQAQNSPSPCVNGVSTNPMAPYNPTEYLPNNVSPYGDYGALFLNDFNWIPLSPSGSLGILPTTGINHLGTTQYMYPPYNPPVGQSQYYQYLRDERKMPNPVTGYPGYFPNHQNGWELIGVNLGFFPDGTPYSEFGEFDENGLWVGEVNHFERIPYIVLYNRYLSKIRVFANVGTEWSLNHAYQAVRITLTLNTGDGIELNGLFRLQSGMDQTLDQNTSVVSAGALAQAPNDKQRWFSADFPVAYDPCVCSYESQINISFSLVKNFDFTLHGRQISIEEEIVDDDGNFVPNNDFFTSGFAVNALAPDVNHGGFIMYEKMENLFEDYIKRLEYQDSVATAIGAENKIIKRRKAILKASLAIIQIGVGTFVGGPPGAFATIGTAVATLSADAPDMLDLTYSSSTTEKKKDGIQWGKLLKEAEKILGKEISTWISDNFKEKDAPPIPNKPTATFSEMYFQGQLTQNDPIEGHTFYTPGTYGRSVNDNLDDQHIYPVYNEPLGVFALLEKPKLEFSMKDDMSLCFNSGSHNYYPNKYVHYYSHEVRKYLQFRLKDELKYFINPKLNINDINVLASIDVYSSVKDGAINWPMDVKPFGSIDWQRWNYVVTNPNYNANVESVDFEIDEVNELYIQENKYPNGFKIQGIYSPIDAFKNLTYGFGYSSQFIFPSEVEEVFQVPTFDANSPGMGNGEFWNENYIHHWMMSPYATCDGANLEWTGAPWIPPSGQQLGWRLNHKFSRYLDIDSADLKLIINVEFGDLDTDGNPHRTTFMFTYRIPKEDIIDIANGGQASIISNLHSSDQNLTQYPENLILDGVNFNGGVVNGCNLNGTTYLCKAWNDIEIYGDNTIAAGYEVIVEAGNEIIQHPESVMPPESILQIVPMFDYSNPMPPVSAEYVGNFCKTDNLYNANRAAPHIQAYYDSISQANPPQLEEKAPIEFIVFPNPTTGASQAGLSLPELATVSISIVDITGKVQGRPVQNQVLPMGRNVLNLESEPLAPGVYFVQVVVNGEKLTQRLVKQ